EPEDLRTLLIAGIRSPIESYFAGQADSFLTSLPERVSTRVLETDFMGSVAKAAVKEATLCSRVACLHALAIRGRYDELEIGLQQLLVESRHHWSVRFLQIDMLRERGEFGRAFALCLESKDPASSELAAPRLRQLARICREWGFPGLALPWLREWLER